MRLGDTGHDEAESPSVDFPEGERVLVTGATGLIGRTVLALLAGRCDTYAVSRNPVDDPAATTWFQADLTTPGVVREIVQAAQPSVIVHLAGHVHGDRVRDLVRPTLSVNLVATVALLEEATSAEVRRIVVSGSLLEEPRGPSDAVVPPSPYGASQLASSQYARMFHALFGTPVTILRPAYVYGPGQDEKKLLPYVIIKLSRGERPELTDGERRMDFVYSEDVGRAFVAAAATPEIEGMTIDVGSGELQRVRDVVHSVELTIGSSPPPDYGALAERPLEQEIRVDTAPARRLLGWQAKTSLEEGLRKTVAWYRASLAGRSSAGEGSVAQTADDVTAAER